MGSIIKREAEVPESSRVNYKRFILVVFIVVFGILAFIGWSLTKGQGESNLGVWLFASMSFSLRNAFIFILFSLVFKEFVFIFLKVGRNHPIISISLITLVVSLFFSYFLIPELFTSKSHLSLFYWSIVSGGLPALIISTVSYLLKIKQPNFWRLTLGPAIIIYSLTIFFIPVAISGWNSVLTRRMACDLVVGERSRLNCYRAEAIITGDAELCISKNLDLFGKGDCILDIAMFKKDKSFCEYPVIKANDKNYIFCLSEASGENK